MQAGDRQRVWTSDVAFVSYISCKNVGYLWLYIINRLQSSCIFYNMVFSNYCVFSDRNVRYISALNELATIVIKACNYSRHFLTHLAFHNFRFWRQCESFLTYFTTILSGLLLLFWRVKFRLNNQFRFRCFQELHISSSISVKKVKRTDQTTHKNKRGIIFERVVGSKRYRKWRHICLSGEPSSVLHQNEERGQNHTEPRKLRVYKLLLVNKE